MGIGTISFLAIVGILCTLAGISFYQKIARIEKWTKTKAIIIEKWAQHSPDKQGATQSCQYEMGILYQYELNGKNYECQNYSVATVMMSRKDVEKKLNALPNEIMVYVNPENPSEAYYQISTKWLAFAAMATGIICLVILVIGLVILK